MTMNIYIRPEIEARLREEVSMSGLINLLLTEHYRSTPRPVKNEVVLEDGARAIVIRGNSEPTNIEVDPEPKRLRLSAPTTLEDKLAGMSEAEANHHKAEKAKQDETDRLITKGQAAKLVKFCKEGHAIPEGRSRCMGKVCKYA